MLRQQLGNSPIRLPFYRRLSDRDDKIYPVDFLDKFFFGARLGFDKNFHKFLFFPTAHIIEPLKILFGIRVYFWICLTRLGLYYSNRILVLTLKPFLAISGNSFARNFGRTVILVISSQSISTNSFFPCELWFISWFR